MSDLEAAVDAGEVTPSGLFVLDGLSDPRCRPGSVSAIRDAAQTLSSFYLRRHGAESAVARLFEQARAFYALPVEQRLEVAARGPQGSGYHGADRRTQIYVANRAGPEMRELFGEDRFPAQLPDFAAAIDGYFSAMYALSMDVLAAVAAGLGLAPDFFASMFGPRAIQNLQLRYYDGAPPLNPVPLAAHTDPPPITLIAQDDVGGLESAYRGRWVQVRPLPETLVCQFGALMARWTDDRYPASVHRVLSTEHASRISLVYNVLPAPDAVIERVPTCRARDASPYAAPVTVDRFLRERLRDAVSYAPSATDPAASEAPRRHGDVAPDVLTRCREAISRGSRGAWSLQRASQNGAAVRLDVVAAGQPLVLDLSRAEPGRPCYQVLGNVGVSYRGKLPDGATRTLDAVLPGVASAVAAALGAVS